MKVIDGAQDGARKGTKTEKLEWLARSSTLHVVQENDVKLFNQKRLTKPLKKLTTLDQSMELIGAITDVYRRVEKDIYRYDICIPRNDSWHNRLHIGRYVVYGSSHEILDPLGKPNQIGQTEISDVIRVEGDNKYASVQRREARTESPNDVVAESSLIMASFHEVRLAIEAIRKASDFQMRTGEDILVTSRFSETYWDNLD